MFRRPWFLAAIAAALLWSLQFATVHFNYGGNWTGLFCIAPNMAVPEFLRSENLYIFPATNGYDGQMFHLIAHDPWMTRGTANLLDNAPLRYQRILVPTLAWMLALGRDRFVDAAYIAVILGFAFLGVFWMARLALIRGLDPAWGLVFLAVPAVVTSLDRMTADIALAAFCVGFVLYSEAESPWRVLLILTCAALTRETAILITAGYGLFLLTQRKLARAIATGCTLLPAGAWFLYVTHGTAHSPAIRYLKPIPLSGFLDRVIHPAVYALARWKNEAGRLFDLVALAGVALLLIFVLKMAIAKRWNPTAAAVYVFAIAVLFLHRRDVWEDAYSFGRVLSPLLLLAFIDRPSIGRSGQDPPENRPRRLTFAALTPALPMLMIDSRILLNLIGEMEGILRGLLK